MANDRREIEKLLVEILDAFNRHDLDAIMEFFAADATLDMPRGPLPWDNGSSARPRSGLASPAGSPGSRTTTTAPTATGSATTWQFPEWTQTGTTTTGRHLEVRGTDHYEFRAGKVIRKDAFWKIVEP